MGYDQDGTAGVGKSSGCSSVWAAAGIRPVPTPAPDVRPLRTPSPGAITPADLDRMLHVWQSRLTGGRSPSTVGLAFLDWAAHAANAPFQTAALGRTALAQWQRLARAAVGGETVIAPQPGDDRFARPAWKQRPSTCWPKRCCSVRNGGRTSCAAPAGSAARPTHGRLLHAAMARSDVAVQCALAQPRGDTGHLHEQRRQSCGGAA